MMIGDLSDTRCSPGPRAMSPMPDAARQAARDARLDRTLFGLDEDRFDAFVALLDAPPAPNEKLKRLFATPPPWEL